MMLDTRVPSAPPALRMTTQTSVHAAEAREGRRLAPMDMPDDKQHSVMLVAICQGLSFPL
jgi:anti-sigma factor ChrR (cupin superfamily)